MIGHPSPEHMLDRTLQIIAEHEQPLHAPLDYTNVGSPGSQGSYSNLPALQHNDYLPIRTVAQHSQMTGFPTHSRSPVQSQVDMARSPAALPSPQQYACPSPSTSMTMSLPSPGEVRGMHEIPYQTPPHDDNFPSMMDDLNEFGNDFDLLAAEILFAGGSPLSDDQLSFGDPMSPFPTGSNPSQSLSSSTHSFQGSYPSQQQQQQQQHHHHQQCHQTAQAVWSSAPQAQTSFVPSMTTAMEKNQSYYMPQPQMPTPNIESISQANVEQQAQNNPRPCGQQWIHPCAPPVNYPHKEVLFPSKYVNVKTDLPIVALWEFLLEALYYPCYEHILKWKTKAEGDFKIVNSSALAKLWGVYKRKKDMNFDKMSRAMRYYYDKGILEKGSSGARLEYKFGLRSHWLEFRPPHGSMEGRFFHSQPPRRTRANRAIAPNSPKAAADKKPVVAATPPSTVVAPTTSIPLSHAPLASAYGQHVYTKPGHHASQNLRFAPY